MEHDRYKTSSEIGIDCICLTMNAEKHLKETLDAWYKEAPIRWLYVIDGHSKDNTVEILKYYPRITVKIEKGQTLGKGFELLIKRVQTPFCIWIDVGKIPEPGWYDTMLEAMGEDKGDILGSVRYNFKEGKTWMESVIMDPSQRMVGGPWMMWTEMMKNYHVDDDYVWRNLDIVIRKQIEEHGGNYALIMNAAHRCYMPPTVTDKKELHRRHIMNAQGIVKYIPPSYAKEHAKYLFNDHWMIMLSLLDKKWIQETNPDWLIELNKRRTRIWIAKQIRKVWSLVTGNPTVE